MEDIFPRPSSIRLLQSRADLRLIGTSCLSYPEKNFKSILLTPRGNLRIANYVGESHSIHDTTMGFYLVVTHAIRNILRSAPREPPERKEI